MSHDDELFYETPRRPDYKAWSPIHDADALRGFEDLGRESLTPEASWHPQTADFTLESMTGLHTPWHNPACQEYPACPSCLANVAANPWMLSAARAQGDNNRPFGA